MMALPLRLACGGPSWRRKVANESAWDIFRPSPFPNLRVLSDALKCCRDFPHRRYRPPDRTLTISASLLEKPGKEEG